MIVVNHTIGHYGDMIFMAHIDDVRVGSVSIRSEGEDNCSVWSLKVEEPYRRMGVASALMRAVMREYGNRNVWLFASGSIPQKALVAFYRSHGFIEDKEHKSFSGMVRMTYTPG